MKKKIIISILLIAAIFGFAVYHFFFDINAIKPGEAFAVSTSPSGEHEITAYLNDGGATTDYAVLCALTDNGRIVRNIYWNYHCDKAEIEWFDDDTVIINGVKLDDVTKDKYDFRQ